MEQGFITIDLTNHPLASVNGAQVQLFYETTSTGYVAIDVLFPYHIEYLGEPGQYFIFIFNDTGKCVDDICDNPYSLTVSYP